MTDIARSVRIHEAIKQQLVHEFEFSPEDQCLIDTLDGLSDLKEQIAALVRDAKHAEAMAEALRSIIANNQSRKMRLDARSERLRNIALRAMEEAGITKIESADMTISQVPGRARVLTPDETLVPDHMCVITRRPNRDAIRELLKDHGFVSYAHLSNVVPILKVKTI